MEQKMMINKDNLIQLGFKEHTAKDIIKQAKNKMVQNGYTLYNNRRLGIVPSNIVEEIIGYPLFQNGRNN